MQEPRKDLIDQVVRIRIKNKNQKDGIRRKTYLAISGLEDGRKS